MIRGILLRALLGVLCLWASAAYADKFSDSYLSLSVNETNVSGQWDIALRDLEFAIGLDSDGNGEITWDEVRAKQADIAAYALSRLALSTDGKSCPAHLTGLLADHHSDGAYAVLRFTTVCPTTVNALTIHYRLLFDIDPQHKGLLRLQGDGVTSSAIFSVENGSQTIALKKISRLDQFGEYLKVGIAHIWAGFDHLLFLFSLLLPAVLTLAGKQWEPAMSFKVSLVDVLKIVTAFTLAHSMTLTLATLQIIALPSRWVESGIAASVVVAALNNLFPMVQGRRWAAAFAFGLIHGFGFASVLTDLGLPPSTLLLALVGFNLGVEIGQLAIVGAFLPIAYMLRRTQFYRTLVFIVGSIAIVLVASVWLIERAFDLKIISV